MTGLTLALALQISLLSTQAQPYGEAHEASLASGRPLVVLVGTDWCPGCRRMKGDVMPQAEADGLLDNVHFAIVDSDRQPTLARRLMRGGSIPQLVVFHQTAEGWKSRRMIGAQSLSTIAEAVGAAVSESEATAGVAPKKKVSPTANR